ncbi:Tfp pilus assembly major pilin PilA, partial [Pontibacter aydingkolensis]
TVVWAKQAGGTNSDYGRGIAVDGQGNAYVTGEFLGTATFGSTTLTSAGYDDIFVAKYDPSGTLVWAKQAGNTNSDYGRGIAVDGQGNAYVTGEFLGTATFEGTTLTSAGALDVFVAKYNASGTVVWAKQAGGTSSDYGRGIAVDGQGNAYVTGEFLGTATLGSTTLTSSGGWDMFVARYDASGNALWAKNPTGTGTADYGRSIAVDGQGNTYVTGEFYGTATFGSTTLTSAGGADIFVAKYDPSGTVLWALRAGGTSNELGFGIAVDGSGNAYVTGYFYGTTTLGSTTLTSSGGWGMFVAKYNASGTVVWAKQAGGTSFNYGRGIAVDGQGNAYVTGEFYGTATFEGTTLTSAGGTDVFVAKYNASGTVVWAKQAGGTSSDYGRGIAVDGQGNAYVTGEFYGTATFEGTTLTSSGGTDMFVAKYNASGTVVWAKQAGGTSSDYGRGIAVDGSGNAYVTGYFFETVSFGTIELISAGRNDMFVAKYNASGTVVWAQRAGGTSHCSGYAIALDSQGGAYVTGHFWDTASFGTTALTSSGVADVFIAKYDASGNALWAQRAGGTGYDIGYGIAVDGSGSARVTGYFYSAAAFGSTSLSSLGAEMFVAKLHSQPNLTGLVDRQLSESLMVYPNPASSSLRVSLSASAGAVHELRLLDVKGMAVLSQFYPMASGEFNQALDLSKLQRGVYLLQVVTDQGVVTKRVVKQ